MHRKLQACRELEEPPVGPVNGMGGMQESKLSTVMQPPVFSQPSGGSWHGSSVAMAGRRTSPKPPACPQPSQVPMCTHA